MIKGTRQRKEDWSEKKKTRWEEREKSCWMREEDFSTCALVEAQPAVLILLPSPLTREDLSRFPTPCLVEYIPFIPLTSAVYLTTLPKSASNTSTPPPKPARSGETLFVKASVSLLLHTHLHIPAHTCVYTSILVGALTDIMPPYGDLNLNLIVVLILTPSLNLSLTQPFNLKNKNDLTSQKHSYCKIVPYWSNLQYINSFKI